MGIFYSYAGKKSRRIKSTGLRHGKGLNIARNWDSPRYRPDNAPIRNSSSGRKERGEIVPETVAGGGGLRATGLKAYGFDAGYIKDVLKSRARWRKSHAR